MPDELSDDILQNDAFSNIGYQRLGQEIFLSVMKLKPPNFFSLHPLKTILKKKNEKNDVIFKKTSPVNYKSRHLTHQITHLYTQIKIAFFSYVAFSR